MFFSKWNKKSQQKMSVSSFLVQCARCQCSDNKCQDTEVSKCYSQPPKEKVLTRLDSIQTRSITFRSSTAIPVLGTDKQAVWLDVSSWQGKRVQESQGPELSDKLKHAQWGSFDWGVPVFFIFGLLVKKEQ